MEKLPKHIYFVSWKKHKVDQALSHVNDICDGFFNDLLFETIIDVFRLDYGFPGALPVQEIIQNEPIVPASTYNINFETQVINRTQKCPVCHENVDASRFTSHLSSKCFKDCPNKMEVVSRFFEQTTNV